MGDSIKFKKGDSSKLPHLETGEPAFTTDEERLYVGGMTENIPVAMKKEFDAHLADSVKQLSWIVTPEMFGAKKDGVTDDSGAFQNSINYLDSKGGGTLVINPGNYYIGSEIRVKSNIHILGYGATLSADIDTRIFVNVANDTREVKEYDVENLTIEGLKVPQCWRFLHLNGFSNVSVKNCNLVSTDDNSNIGTELRYPFVIYVYNGANITVENCKIPGNYSTPGSSNDGIHISGSVKGVVISNCYIQAGDDCIALNAAEDTPGNIEGVTVESCVCYGMSAMRIYGQGVNQAIHGSVRNCYLSGAPTAGGGLFATNSPSTYNDSLPKCSITFTFENCDFISNIATTTPMRLQGMTGCIEFSKCRILQPAQTNPLGYPNNTGLVIKFYQCDFGGQPIYFNSSGYVKLTVQECKNFDVSNPAVKWLDGEYESVNLIDNEHTGLPISMINTVKINNLRIKTKYDPGTTTIQGVVQNLFYDYVGVTTLVNIVFSHNASSAQTSANVPTIFNGDTQMQGNSSLVNSTNTTYTRIKKGWVSSESKLPMTTASKLGDIVVIPTGYFLYTGSAWKNLTI